MKNPMENMQNEPINHGDAEKPLENISLWENKSFYQRLGVSNNATEEEIKIAFKKLSIKYHPDKISNNEKLRANYQEVQKLLSEAKSTLMNQKERMRYDSKLNFGSFSGYNYQKPPRTQEEAKESYKNTQSKESEPTTEVEKIKYFVTYVAREIRYHDTEFPIIKQMMEKYVKSGISREKLLNAVRNTIFSHLSTYAARELRYHDIEFPKIKKIIQDYETLGLTKKELFEVIKKPAIEQLTRYIKLEIKYHDIEFPKIKKRMQDYETIGIDKQELLNILEKPALEELSSYTKREVRYHNIEFPKIKKRMQDYELSGINKKKLLDAVEETFISNFSSFVKNNSRYPSEQENIKKMFIDYIHLGVNEDRLKQIYNK